MRIERLRPAVLRLTLHAYEAAALITAARWVVEGREGELPAEALDQLAQVLEGYDRALAAGASPTPAGGPASSP